MESIQKIRDKLICGFIFFFITWISFFCEYAQIKYQKYVLLIVLFIFAVMLFNIQLWESKAKLIDFLFLACMVAFTLSYFFAVNSNIAFQYYYIVLKCVVHLYFYNQI